MTKLCAAAVALLLGAGTGNAQPADPYADPGQSKPAPPKGQQTKAASAPEDPYAAKGSESAAPTASTPTGAGSASGSTASAGAPKPIAGWGRRAWCRASASPT